MEGSPCDPRPEETRRTGGGSGRRPEGLTAERFAVLFQGAARVLWTIAAGVLGDPTEAEDVLQEACVMALAKLERFQPGTSFTAWMGSFVRNVARNHARKRSRRSTEPVEPGLAGELVGAGGSGPEELAFGLPIEPDGTLRPDQTAFDDRVLAALGELAGEARATLLLRTVLGLSYREIAEALSIPEGTAMSHVHRSRQLLRERLGGERRAERGPELGGIGPARPAEEC